MTVAFTACLSARIPFFVSHETVGPFIEFLRTSSEKYQCLVPIYCFMPDHIHILLQGKTDQANTHHAMSAFKQKAGFWLSGHRPELSLQTDFYDHVVRQSEDLNSQIIYIAANPVRAGIAPDLLSHPFTGAFGYELKDVILGAM